MATTNLDDVDIRRLRLLSADNIEGAYWFTDDELDDLYIMENCDLAQTAASALETRAAQLDAGLGGISSQGVTINASAMSAGLREQANRIRMGYRVP